MSQSPTAQVATTSMNPKDLPTPLLWGLGIGPVAFVVNLSSSSSKSVNGVVTECSYFDAAAMVAAAVCVGCAGFGVVQWVRKRHEYAINHWMVIGAAAVLVLLAGIHVLRGLGMVGGPC